MNTHENEADLLAKLLPAGAKRKEFVRRLLHHIYRSDERVALAASLGFDV